MIGISLNENFGRHGKVTNHKDSQHKINRGCNRKNANYHRQNTGETDGLV